ncbi:MAG: site-2 protease family protein [Actinomycetota bacterium]|nr:site-2 protease family protein [Actinomycetota bacterium]
MPSCAPLQCLFGRPPDPLAFLVIAVVLITSISLHEFGHAFAADRLGDKTARLAGRFTINPLSHLDPVGSFMLVFAGFGWGKPVPFNPRMLRWKRFGAAAVALAGPAVNVLLAFLGAAAWAGSHPGSRAARLFLLTLVQYNVLLAVFNLVPIPPLDGSRILGSVLPPSKQHFIYFLDKWGFVLLLVFVFAVFRPVFGPIVGSLTLQVFRLVGAPLI